MIGKVIFVSGVIFCCGYGWHRWTKYKSDERRRQWDDSDAKRRQLEQCMEGVWSEPRQLIPDIQHELSGPAEAAAVSSAGRVAEATLTPQAQRNAWQASKYLAAEGLTENRDGAIKTVLAATAPGCDWSRGYLPYAHYPRFRDVWESAGVILDLAELSLKYGKRSSTAGNGALVTPGWVHKNPAPTADLKPGDFVEVLVDKFSPSPEDDSRYAEWAWVRVDGAGVGEDINGTITYEAPPGAQANSLRNTESHGFGPGTPILIQRRCIHRVIHGR
jgi:hypothetical protein